MKLKEILLVLLLVAVVSEAVRNKRNRRNKKEAQQQQQQRVARQQQPRQQRQQQAQGQRGARQQRRPNRPAPRRRPRQQQRPQRPRTGAQRAQDFNLPDLKKLTNTKFNCDENKRWSMNYLSNNVAIYLFSKMCFIFNESSGWNSIHLFMFGNISLHWYAKNIKKKNIFFQTVFSGENVLSIEKQLPEEVSHKSRNLAITLGWCHPCYSYNTQLMLCIQ